jgi:hypothetical protein
VCSVFSTKLESQSAGECHGQPSQTGIENWSEMILVCLAPFRDSGAKIPYSHSLSPSPSSPPPSRHTSSDNGDPITGLFIILVVSHGLVTVLETINVLRTSQVNECEEATLSLSTKWPPAPDRRATRSTTSNRPDVHLQSSGCRVRQSRGSHLFSSFTQSPSPPRALVRDWQTSPIFVHFVRLIQAHTGTCIQIFAGQAQIP